MDKALVKEKIIELQSKVVEELQQAYSRDIVSADIDETETKDPEDFSHQGEWNEMARRLELHLQNARDSIEYLNKLSLETLTEVGEGSLVETDKFVFFVSIATHPFKIDGKTVVGISTEAPIYHAMREKQAGDSFAFGDKQYSIVSVQ